MLSMSNLVFANKLASKQYMTLLEILVNYLKDKFLLKIGGKNLDNTSNAQSMKNRPKHSRN